MPYTQLKEKLEQLLTEDLSNRNNLQETRRNLFLNSEAEKLKIELNAKTEATALLVDPKLLEEKNAEIESLKTQLTTAAEAQATLVDTKLVEEKTAEIELLKEKSDLLSDSEQQLKV